jgi:hypothetical protein
MEDMPLYLRTLFRDCPVGCINALTSGNTGMLLRWSKNTHLIRGAFNAGLDEHHLRGEGSSRGRSSFAPSTRSPS